jgi:hypothetical protein
MNQPADASELQIIGAAYGQGKVTSKVIELVNRTTTPQSLSVQASNAVFGDTWPGYVKVLTVAYRYGSTGSVQVAAVTENQTLTIGAEEQEGSLEAEAAETTGPTLSILAATYGPANETSKVQGMVDQSTQTLSVPVNNTTFGGDPFPGHVKTLVVVAAYKGQVPFVDITTEGGTYNLKYRPPLQILSASWGIGDVLTRVQSAVSRRALRVEATDANLGDTWVGVRKSLDVVYRYQGKQPQLAIVSEGETLSVDYDPDALSEQPPPPDPRALNLIKAAYGRGDVTAKVAPLITNNELHLIANDATFSDTWPGVRKSFSLTYSWGPQQPLDLVVPENGNVDITAAEPDVVPALVSIGGLMANEDKIALATGYGNFWAVDPSGKVVASATSRQDGADFTVGWSLTHPDQISLATSAGNVVAAADGTLHVIAGGTPAVFTPAVSTLGTVALGVAGAGWCTAAMDGSITASGNDPQGSQAAFSLFLKPTQAGTENHLRAYGLDSVDDESLPSPQVLKVGWDLTGGFVAAIGLGPLLSEGKMSTGVWSLLRSSPRVSAAIDAILNGVKREPWRTLAVVSCVSVVTELFREGRLFAVLRLLVETATWWGVAWLATQVVAKLFNPEIWAAELLVSFGFWVWTTTTDVLAWINSGQEQASRATLSPGR